MEIAWPGNYNWETEPRRFNQIYFCISLVLQFFVPECYPSTLSLAHHTRSIRKGLRMKRGCSGYGFFYLVL